MALSPVAFDHIAFGVRHVAQAVPFLIGSLGGKFYHGGAGDGTFQGFLHRFVEKRGGAPHHVTFKVKDTHAAREHVQRCGFDVVGFDDTSPSWKELFLHPKQALGIVVQLAEHHPEVPGSWGSDYQELPPLPTPAAKPAQVLGLRLIAHSAEKARSLWTQVLAGECEERSSGKELIFTWPQSPMRVAVSLTTDKPEGPHSIELLEAETEDEGKSVFVDELGTLFRWTKPEKIGPST